jgi:hypothetical protein
LYGRLRMLASFAMSRHLCAARERAHV